MSCEERQRAGCYWLVEGEGDGRAEELEGAALDGGGIGEFLDPLAAEGDGLAVEGGQVVQQVAVFADGQLAAGALGAAQELEIGSVHAHSCVSRSGRPPSGPGPRRRPSRSRRPAGKARGSSSPSRGRADVPPTLEGGVAAPERRPNRRTRPALDRGAARAGLARLDWSGS